MRLIDLEPRWLEQPAGRRVALMFLCPHCLPAKRQWLTCFFVPAGSLPVWDDTTEEWMRGLRGDRRLFYHELIKMGATAPNEELFEIVGCNKDMAWTRNSDDLNTMSITPSIDASASGHWHGYVTNGQIV